jgi:hypothetical protein
MMPLKEDPRKRKWMLHCTKKMLAMVSNPCGKFGKIFKPFDDV